MEERVAEEALPPLVPLLLPLPMLASSAVARLSTEAGVEAAWVVRGARARMLPQATPTDPRASSTRRDSSAGTGAVAVVEEEEEGVVS